MEERDLADRIKVHKIPTEVVHGTESFPIVERNIISGELYRICNPERNQQLNTYIFWDDTLLESEQRLVLDAVNDLYDYIGFNKDKISSYGEWCSSKAYDLDRKLVPYESTKWVMQKAYNRERKQLDAQVILNTMRFDPYQKSYPHWEILFTANDLYYGNSNFWVGGASPDLGTVISLRRFRDIQDKSLQQEVIRTEVFHEVGHVLGLPSRRRGVANLEDSLGLHCKSSGCSMKQGLRVPSDWVTTTVSRLRDNNGRPYCRECDKDLDKKLQRK